MSVAAKPGRIPSLRRPRPQPDAEPVGFIDRPGIATAFTNTGHSRRRHGLCSMLLLPAVSGSLNRLAFHAPLLPEPRR